MSRRLFVVLCLLGLVGVDAEVLWTISVRGGLLFLSLSLSLSLFAWLGCPSSTARRVRASSARLRSGGVVHLRGILIGVALAVPRLGVADLHFAWASCRLHLHGQAGVDICRHGCDVACNNHAQIEHDSDQDCTIAAQRCTPGGRSYRRVSIAKELSWTHLIVKRGGQRLEMRLAL